MPATKPTYQELLVTLRQAFPQPVSDRVHDAYVAFSVLRALDQIDALKSQTPILGQPSEPDFSAARMERLPMQGRTLEEVIPELVRYLEGLVIWGHPQSQVNVCPNPTIASLIGMLLPALFNPNLCSDESGRRVSEVEVRVTAMIAELVGYDPEEAGGVFTFGGTGAMLYGLKVGLEKAFPDCGRDGLRGDAVILCSEQSHYSCLNVASWLGIGQANVIRVPTHADNSIKLGDLEKAAKEAISAGKRISAIIATLGTTDAFGLDDLEAIHGLREMLVLAGKLDYTPHIHADAVIGWAWSVFDDYPFAANPLGFRGRTVRALAAAARRVRHLGLADSIGIDFHKTGFTPYVSTLALFRERTDLERIARDKAAMPYLFQSGEHHPGMFTLETTRSGGGPMAALASLLLLGKTGYQTLLGHAVEMAEVLRELIEGHPDVTTLNGDNVGPVTLFRVYPHGVDTFTVAERERSDPAFREQLLSYNDYNRRVFQRVNADALAGRGVAISLTDCYRKTDYGEPIVALKSYVLSPFSDESRMRSVLEHVLAAREARDAAGSGWTL